MICLLAECANVLLFVGYLCTRAIIFLLPGNVNRGREGRLQPQFKMKVQASVKRRCEKCKIIKRKGIVRVICENPRHKQRQG